MSGHAEPLCDRISHIAAELENSAGDLRGMPGVSRLRAALPAAVAALRHIADQVLEQGVELDELERLRAERERMQEGAAAVAELAAAVSDQPDGDLSSVGHAIRNIATGMSVEEATAGLSDAWWMPTAPQRPERGGEAL